MYKMFLRIGHTASLLLAPIMVCFFIWDVLSFGLRAAISVTASHWEANVASPWRVTLRNIRNP